MTKNKYSLSNLFRATLLGAVFSFSAAVAEEIPEDMLVLDYSKCMQGCLNATGQTSCEVLCGCSMSRFRSNLDLAAYNDLFSQMSRDEVSPENRKCLDETATVCVAELDQLIEDTLPEIPELSELPPPEDEGGLVRP